MAESKVGEEFVKHEFDEAIAIQRAIVQAERSLAESHPHAGSRTAVAEALRDDQQHLDRLTELGREKGATGEVEDVAEGVIDLLRSMVAKAAEAPSEAYEAHAVLLNAKRKQQDSAGGMLRIARALDDRPVADAAQEFGKAQRAASNQLATQLAAFAAVIASAEDDREAREQASKQRSSRRSTGSRSGSTRRRSSSSGRSGSRRS